MRGTSFKRRMLQRVRQLALTAVGSTKIKLLISCCFVFFILIFATGASDFIGWTGDGGPAVRFSAARKLRYAILINTWKRHDLLKQSISHYATCSGVDSIHIIWSEPDPPSDSLVSFLQQTVKSNSRNGKEPDLRFDINREDSLNNRFKEIKDLNTDAVFSIDDDVVFPCSSVEFAFSVWKSAPDAMVGFVPRMHWVDGLGSFIYGGWWSVWWTGTYSIVLSKAAFFHTKYLSLYTNKMPSSIREYVTKNRNCEDIAMSFLVANASGSPPIWVKGKIYEIGSSGISSMGGHSEKRTQCLNRFVAEYGGMPLIPTTVKAVDSRKIWFW